MRVLLGLGIVFAYVGTAVLGFQFALVAEQVTTVWAPTGLAIAALLLRGVRLWPAVWIGAFIANLGTEAPTWSAAAIATGNTLEAVIAAWALRERTAFEPAFCRMRDAVSFVLIAGLSSPLISATVGVATLCAAGVQPWHRFSTVWFDWWLGDALGAVVIAPAILTTLNSPWSRRELQHTILWVAIAVGVAHFIFGPTPISTPQPVAYFVFAVAIGATVSGGPRIATLVVLSASAVTLWHTVRGSGPFGGRALHDSLILLQIFMGTLAGTTLLVAAVVAERMRIQVREREAVTALRQRDTMLQLAQLAGGVGTFEWDFRNGYARCSAEFFRLFGLPSEEGTITTAQWGEFVHPDDRERMSAHLTRVLSGAEPPAADYRITTADGHTRWISYSGQIQATAAGDRLVGTVVDVTERVGAEAALRESRDVLSLAMRGGAMGAWSRNLTTNEVWWSPELEEIFGLSRGSFTRTESGFFDYVHPEDRDAVQSAVHVAVTSGTDYVVEFRFRHADGDWRWMEGRGRAVYGDDGTPQTLYGIGIDVTARKRAELTLLEAKAGAESANQVKDQFLATLSHELRTPLNTILGYARMLQTDAITSEKRSHAVDVIARNAALQAELVEDLLDMSRISTGKLRLEPQLILVATVLREALDSITPAADARGVAFDVHVAPDAGMVTADATRLHQVFWNLLSNAVKFTRHGRITVSLTRDRDHVEVIVHDTGEGIAPAFLPYVFEPFRQADAGFDRARGGLGLGLAITKRLVELHGGTIAASSAGVGQGATFTVRLPCASSGIAGPPVSTSVDAT